MVTRLRRMATTAVSDLVSSSLRKDNDSNLLERVKGSSCGWMRQKPTVELKRRIESAALGRATVGMVVKRVLELPR